MGTRSKRRKGSDTEDWLPRMSPTQTKIFYDERPYQLLYGERGSGKTIVALNKVVKHCVEYRNALAIICTLTRAGTTAGGAWENLLSMETTHDDHPIGVLEVWREGFDLTYSEEYGDKAGNKWVDVQTLDGGVSRIMQLSLNAPTQVFAKVKNMKPSLFFYDELTDNTTQDYFFKVIQQLGRRQGVPANKQYFLGACNPAAEGEKHWVYKVFFEGRDSNGAVDINGTPYDKKYGVWHVPMTENVFMEDKESYIDKVMQECKTDPTSYDRNILGRWVPKMVGSAIFEGYFNKGHHVKGEEGKSGLFPIPYENGIKNPIIVGHDPGEVNVAKVFLQRHRLGDKYFWRVLSSYATVGEKLTIEQTVKNLLDKMVALNKQAGVALPFMHIGDSAGWTHWNSQGDYTYKKYFEISKHLIENFPKYKELTPVRVVDPKKTGGSKVERVNAVRDKLLSDEMVISATAEEVIQMFMMLKKKKDDVDEPLKTPSGEIHTFDALSYPIYYFDLLGKSRVVSNTKKDLELISISV